MRQPAAMSLFANLHWNSTFGDPTIWGWSITMLYFICALLCYLVAHSFSQTTPYDSLDREPLRLRRFWFSLFLALLLLGLNKQLDLQTLATELGRIVAREHGWYGERRKYQMIVLAVVFAVSLIFIGLTLNFGKYLGGLEAMACVGTITLLVFILTRAASFHHLDLFLGQKIFGLKCYKLLELTGLGIIFCSSLLKYRICRRKPQP